MHVLPTAFKCSFQSWAHLIAVGRYGGEWKLPGGNVDDGETPEQCARRELVEVGLQVLPASDTTFHARTA